MVRNDLVFVMGRAFWFNKYYGGRPLGGGKNIIIVLCVSRSGCAHYDADSL